MKLKQLIKDREDLVVKGSKEIEITGISAHSKTVAPGYIFIAKRGKKNDGNHFVREAIQAGASAIVSDLYDPSLTVTQIISKDVAHEEASLAKRYFGDPSKELFVVGVTGTNGKTTTTYAIKHLLDGIGMPAGLIGTIEYMVGKAIYHPTHTTPDVISNHKMLREMVRSGCKACVMEVSSHALDQGRVDGIDFDLVIFTNLNHEHLDYHKTMEAYAEAKSKLFRNLKAGKHCLVNADDPWVEKMILGCPVKPMTYGIEKEADLMAENISFSTRGSSFSVWYKEERVDFFWPLPGKFNVLNALCVIGAALIRGVVFAAIPPLLALFQAVPGRLERVVVDDADEALLPALFVDYAHKPEALRNVLQTLRECAHGNIITVFGCGGERDVEKRPIMAKIAESLSDKVIVTSDNPRGEDPQEIIRDIVAGFTDNTKYECVVDRAQAIERAVTMATKDDIILIAGKGHEATQQFQHHAVDFDDKVVARQCLEKHKVLFS